MIGDGRRKAEVLLAVCAAVLVGCSGRESDPAPIVSVEDSAGVRFVRVPRLESFSVPRLALERLYSTANIGGEPLDLFRVRDALFLPGGELVVANGGTEELIFLDADGRSFRRFGGRGDGPGEFNRLWRLVGQPDGGFLAWDHRLSRFDTNGEFVGTARLDPESRVVSLEPLAVYSDGRIVATLGDQRYFQSDGERRDTVPLMVFASEEALPDTVGTWLGLERAFGALSRQGTFVAPIGFARTVFYGANSERIAIGSSDSLDITVFDANLDIVLRIVAPPSERRPSESEREAWRDYAMGLLPMDNEVVRATWSVAPVRETFPGFEGLGVDGVGRLWLGEATVPGSPRRRWVVFDADGSPLGEWETRAGWFSYLPGRTELLALGTDRLALIRRNDFDEESIEVWKVDWTPHE